MKLTNENLLTLLELCEQNHQQAQLEVYNRYYRAMFNTSYRIVGAKMDAEEIMQDCFLKAFKKLNSLNDRSTFGAWLKRIVINESIYRYNQTKKLKETGIEEKLYKMEAPEQENDGMETGAMSEKIKIIMSAMKRLKENYRMSLTLHLIEGFDYEEISQIMNISNGNCRTMISRAKDSLRKQLEPILM